MQDEFVVADRLFQILAGVNEAFANPHVAVFLFFAELVEEGLVVRDSLVKLVNTPLNILREDLEEQSFGQVVSLGAVHIAMVVQIAALLIAFDEDLRWSVADNFFDSADELLSLIEVVELPLEDVFVAVSVDDVSRDAEEFAAFGFVSVEEVVKEFILLVRRLLCHVAVGNLACGDSLH